jgi:hypothetical protein
MVKYNLELLNEVIDRDNAYINLDLDSIKLNKDTQIYFICSCGEEGNKSFKVLNLNGGAFCKICTDNISQSLDMDYKKTKICIKCKIEKDTINYHKNINTCKTCVAIYDKQYINTHRGFFVKLLKASKTNSKKRSNEAGKHSITIQDLYKQWDIQNGLCYYSYIPMITKSNHDW